MLRDDLRRINRRSGVSGCFKISESDEQCSFSFSLEALTASILTSHFNQQFVDLDLEITAIQSKKQRFGLWFSMPRGDIRIPSYFLHQRNYSLAER
jgi:hypothetical protein